MPPSLPKHPQSIGPMAVGTIIERGIKVLNPQLYFKILNPRDHLSHSAISIHKFRASSLLRALACFCDGRRSKAPFEDNVSVHTLHGTADL